MTIKWDVFLSNKADKQKANLNEDLQAVLMLLVEDLKNKGDAAGVNWPNYGKFKGLKGQKKRDD